MKILVTGSNGFIGKRLVQKLRALGREVIEFSGNILEDDSYQRLLKEDVTHCFHLAAKSFVPESWKNPSDYIETNVYGTEKVLEYCRYKQASFTFISSYMYGSPKYLPIDEKHPLQPSNPYALSKYLGEELCRFYSEHFKMKISIIRPFNIYGPGQDGRFLIPLILDQFYSDSKEVKLMDLSPKRDYIYVDDLTEALVLTVNVKDQLTVLNIGSGYSLSVTEVIKEIKKASGIEKEVQSAGETRPNEIPDTVAEISQAKRILGWEPKVSFAEGIRKIIEQNYLRTGKKVN
jgi:nucleoside-diphosphate-sugar epimerase